MDKARRKKDIVVGVISYKKFEGDRKSFAQIIADMIKIMYELSHLSIVMRAASNIHEIYDVIHESAILIIDKSLCRNLEGNDGIALINQILDEHPEKLIISMSSTYGKDDIRSLNRTGVIIRIKKDFEDSFVWKKAITICADILELQDHIDQDA